MGDRTYYPLALPSILDPEAARMAAIAFTGDAWNGDAVRRLLAESPDHTLWINIQERSVGECRDAADAVLEALHEEGRRRRLHPLR